MALEKCNRCEVAHLINLIKRRSGGTPNFALFAGAGSSISSNIKSAKEMTLEWRRQLFDESNDTRQFDDWLKDQNWFNDEDEYSILFEKAYDQRSHRRIYIEDCVKDAKPSWGYIYLANLIAHNFFNVVFTSNFDDLLNEACFSYANLKPMVCAHDSAVGDIRITSTRPKIIKLHGDFLYDSIKNTIKETDALEDNMRDKFKQFAREYGLIVVGYSGSDKSIMDILDATLRTQGCFPNGLYWCVKRGAVINKKLERLLSRENVYWIEIDGFDEFMAELHSGLTLTLPDTVRDPYKATTEKVNRFILPTNNLKHPVIMKDMAELEKHVKKFEHLVTKQNNTSGGEFDGLVPYKFLGDRDFFNRKYDSAIAYYKKAQIQQAGDPEVFLNLGRCYKNSNKFNEAYGVVKEMIKNAQLSFLGYGLKGDILLRENKQDDAVVAYTEALKFGKEGTLDRAIGLTNRANAFIVSEKLDEAIADTDAALAIKPEYYPAIVNKALALRLGGGGEEAKKILEVALPKINDKYTRACAFATIGDKENMLKELLLATQALPVLKDHAKNDPDFKNYHEDIGFKKIIQ